MRHEWTFLSQGPPVCIACAAHQGDKILPDCRGAAWYDNNRTRARERYWRLKKQGVCTACGLEKAQAGSVRCKECCEDHNEFEKLRKEAQK